MADPKRNAAWYFVDRHAGSEILDKAAFVESETGRSISYGELAVATGKLASVYERHEIRREDRVAMLVLDQIEFPILFWGSLKAGVIPVALNTLLSTEIYGYILDDSRASAIVVSEALLPVVEPLFSRSGTLRKIFVVGDSAPEHCISLRDELAQAESRPLLPVISDECAFWLYSSGSTGQPKGVRHVHGSLKSTADTYGAKVLGIEQNDTVFSAAKMFFAYGLGNSMTFPMSVGATTVTLSGRPTPEALFEIFDKFEPTIFFGVPTLYAAMNAALDADGKKLPPSLRRCISAGEALPREVAQRWQKHSGCEVLDGVGSTEMLHIFLSNAPGKAVYGTAGTAVPGYDIRLVDEAGAEVGENEIGELLVRGDSAAIDYWNLREKSRNTFEGWWTRTGDKYERAPEGRLIYCGRTDDMFKVSGIWVSPFEVEQSLIEHEAVLEAAVVPGRDEDGLEKPKAFVVLKEGAAAQDLGDILKEHVKTGIGKWKYPRWIEFVDDLPKTSTGKIQRFKLRGEDQ